MNEMFFKMMEGKYIWFVELFIFAMFTTGPTIVHPDCQWTAWINTDRPTFGNGDMETISKIRQIHQFCASPAMIECRDVHSHTPVKDSTQKVTCDLMNGLKCLNWDNAGDCLDYEVRFFCPCTCKYLYLCLIS